MTAEETKIYSLFKKYGGWRRVTRAKDFIIALFASIIFSVTILYLGNISDVIDIIAPLFISIIGVLVGIVIAGMAIIVSFSDIEFIKFLKSVKINNSDVFTNIMVHFYIPAISSIICLLISIYLMIVKIYIINDYLLSLILFFTIFFFLYTLFATTILFETIIRYGIYRSEFIHK